MVAQGYPSREHEPRALGSAFSTNKLYKVEQELLHCSPTTTNKRIGLSARTVQTTLLYRAEERSMYCNARVEPHPAKRNLLHHAITAWHIGSRDPEKVNPRI